MFVFFFNDTATTEIYTRSLVGSVRCVDETVFDEKGQIIIDTTEEDIDTDELEMIAIEAGAEDISIEDDGIEIITNPEDFSQVREAIEKAGIPMAEASITMIPQTYTSLTDEEDIKKMNRLLDLLDEDDDVKNVYHNWEEAE